MLVLLITWVVPLAAAVLPLVLLPEVLTQSLSSFLSSRSSPRSLLTRSLLTRVSRLFDVVVVVVATQLPNTLTLLLLVGVAGVDNALLLPFLGLNDLLNVLSLLSDTPEWGVADEDVGAGDEVGVGFWAEVCFPLVSPSGQLLLAVELALGLEASLSVSAALLNSLKGETDLGSSACPDQ